MVLITGGTGLVGSHLLYLLLREHGGVRATKRAGSDLKPVLETFASYGSGAQKLFDKIEWVTADITNLPQLTGAFAGIAHVYHAAACISFDPARYGALKKTNSEGTANIVNLCLANNIKKLCYVSSVITLGSTANNLPVTEGAHWNAGAKNNVYAITKHSAEMEVWRGAQEGLAVVVVNPGVILGGGHQRSPSGQLIKLLKGQHTYFVPGSTGFVDVRDVARALLQLMKSEIKNERFILVAENLGYREIVTLFAHAFKNNPPRKKIAKGWLRAASAWDYLVSKIGNGPRRLPQGAVTALYTKTRYDGSKIEGRTGFTYTPIAETVARIKNYCPTES